jgi:hypothetical protein
MDARRRRSSVRGAARGSRPRRDGLRPARLAVRAVRDRHRRATLVGPYAVVTVEVRPGLYETSVTWGDGGAEISGFDRSVAFARPAADRDHEETCRAAERVLGVARRPAPASPAA